MIKKEHVYVVLVARSRKCNEKQIGLRWVFRRELWGIRRCSAFFSGNDSMPGPVWDQKTSPHAKYSVKNEANWPHLTTFLTRYDWLDRLVILAYLNVMKYLLQNDELWTAPSPW